MKKEEELGTKERLMNAMRGLVAQKGYLGTTTREIAEQAGVREVTLFRHFGTKERLFEEALKCYTFLPELTEIIKGVEGRNYKDALKLLATRFLRFLKENKELFRIVISEINMYPEQLRALHRELTDQHVQALASYFTDGQKAGVLVRFPVREAAMAFLGMFFTFFFDEEMMRGKDLSQEKVDTIVRAYVNIFTNGTLKLKA